MAKNNFKKKLIEKIVDQKLEQSNFSTYEKDVIKDTFVELEELYGKELNSLDIIKSLDKVSSIEGFSPEENRGYSSKLEGSGNDFQIYYEKSENPVETKANLTREIIDLVSAEDEKVKNVMFGKDVDVSQYTEEAINEAITKKVLEGQGLKYEGQGAEIEGISNYGNVILDANEKNTINAYFENLDRLAYNHNFEKLDEAMVNVFDGNFVADNEGKEINELNKVLTDYVGGKFGNINEYETDHKDYFQITDDIKDLPNMNSKNIDNLDFERFAGYDKVSASSYFNENSNFNNSLDIIDVVRENLPNEEFRRADDKNLFTGFGKDDKDIDFKDFLKGKETDEIKFNFDEKTNTVTFELNDKFYSFEKTEDGGYNNFKQVEDIGNLKLDNKLFEAENIADLVNGSKNLKGKDLDFSEIADLKNETNWMNDITNNFKGADKIAFDVVQDGKLNILDIQQAKDFEDKAGNNILHVAALSDANIENNSFLKQFGNGFDLNAIDNKSNEELKALLTEKNADGKTPLDVAVENGNTNSIEDIYKLCKDLKIDEKEYSSGQVDYKASKEFAEATSQEFVDKDVKETNLFNKLFDKDGNGKVDFVEAMKNSLDKDNDGKFDFMDKINKAMDKDNDGKNDLGEKLSPVLDKVKGILDKDNNGGVDFVEKINKAMDKDNDGKNDLGEALGSAFDKVKGLFDKDNNKEDEVAKDNIAQKENDDLDLE